jgi:4-amino-4-deoxy-L-arabinose transferase-like glycosyltransferase
VTLSPSDTSVEERRSARSFPVSWLPLAIALVLGMAFAVSLPAYSGPDEVGHVAYVAALAHGRLPTIPVGAHADIATGTTWQGQHPPLFYLLATPFYLLAGKNPLIGLYALRLLGVGALLMTVALIQRLASVLLSPERAVVAASIVALHPTVVYVAAMANNEALSMAFSVACVLASVNGCDVAKDDDKKRRFWLILTVLFGGLGLLTKLTAIAGVAAAATIAGQRRDGRGFVLRGLAVFVGAIGIWLPWGLYMHSVHGTFVPSPVQRPLLNDGLWAFALYPGPVFGALAIAVAQYAIGLAVPYWLIAVNPWTHNVMLAGGWLIAAGTIFMSVNHRKWRFVGVAFTALAGLVLSQMLFRDGETILFLARYTPVVTVFAALMAVGVVSRWAPRVRITTLALWGVLITTTVAYIFYFFLIGPPISATWR